MNRKKSLKSQHERGKGLQSQDVPVGGGKKRIVLICLTILVLIAGLFWMVQPRGQSKGRAGQASRPTGPRLQADPMERSLEPQKLSFTLPSESEVIEMAKLQDEMIEQAKHLENLYAKNPAALDLAASVYYDINRLEEADRLWKACIALSPTDAEHYVNYARFLTNLERSEEAISLLESAHAGSIETAGTYYLMAMAYERSGQLERACEISEEVTRRFPDYGDNWLLIGKVQNQLGRFLDAQKSLQRALELGQIESDVWPVLIPVLARLGNRQEAAELRQKMKELQDSYKVTDAEGELQPFQEKFEASLRSRAVRLYHQSAIIEEESRNTDEAVRLITRAIQIEPDNPASLVYLAELFVEVKRISDAIMVYQRLIEVQPENVINFSNLAGLAFRERNPQLAATVLEAGVQAHPDMLALQIPLAKIYISLERPLKARALANKILASHANQEAMMILGASYQITGDKDEAARAFEQARLMNVAPIKN